MTKGHDLSGAGAPPDELGHAAALADLEVQPLTPERVAGMKKGSHCAVSSSCWTISHGEAQAVSRWWQNHRKRCSRYAAQADGASDQTASYAVMLRPGSGIGLAVDVLCDCGVKQDVTDYSRW